MVRCLYCFFSFLCFDLRVLYVIFCKKQLVIALIVIGILCKCVKWHSKSFNILKSHLMLVSSILVFLLVISIHLIFHLVVYRFCSCSWLYSWIFRAKRLLLNCGSFLIVFLVGSAGNFWRLRLWLLFACIRFKCHSRGVVIDCRFIVFCGCRYTSLYTFYLLFIIISRKLANFLLLMLSVILF